jgi:lactate dehydrogenase-like 2-hydroxyacid dehydrogenase
MPETVLITQQQFDKAKEIFRSADGLNCEPAPAEEETLAGIVLSRNIRIVVVGVDPYRRVLYESLGKANGALIARFGVGHNNINKALAHQYGIIVTNTPGTLDTSVAEHAIWLMGNLARYICKHDSQFHAGNFIGHTGTELHEKTLGILGFGNIGKRVAAIAHFGFGMRVIAADSRPLPSSNQAKFMAEHGVEHYTSDSEQIFRQADFISIHLPSNAETRHFINATRLSWMKPGSYLINTARGDIVDEAALYDALSTGRLAGAALDVFENEPYQPVLPGKDLRRLENVILTPHIGSNTREANNRMAISCLENIRNFLSGHYELLARVDL